MAERSRDDGALVQLSERLTNSTAFSNLFREGMDLVEETAAYLDGVGRTEAKALDRAVSLTYATESMRLTTRLMQLASWLLLHRAVKEGEMTLTQANREKTKVKLSAADPGAPDMIAKLPTQLQDLIARYEDPSEPYRSRTAPQFVKAYASDYDHLARVYEWSTSGEEEDE